MVRAFSATPRHAIRIGVPPLSIDDLDRLIRHQDARLVGRRADERVPGGAWGRFAVAADLIAARAERSGMARAWQAVTSEERDEEDPRVGPYSTMVAAVERLKEAADTTEAKTLAYRNSISVSSAGTQERRETDFVAAVEAWSQTAGQAAARSTMRSTS